MNTYKHDSLFHAGEQAIQERVGVRDHVEEIGRRFLRSYMPDQHRDFFEKLPFMVVGSVDKDGWPWTSIVSGKPGFSHSPKPNILTIKTPIEVLDPLHDSIKKNSKLGLLGIEPSTRRRNRMNANISSVNDSEITLTVDQSFGNCPKYIHTRELEFVRDPNTLSNKTKKTNLTEFDGDARQLIRRADTFFVSSYVCEPDSDVIQGVDASHRGGKPGFIKLEGNSLTIPDYYGNNLFNTLGNFLKNPKAGLLFSDFSTGDVLMLTGTVEILWEDDSNVKIYKGAERAWTFHLDHGFWLTDILPFRAPLDEYSPFLEGLGDWQNIDLHATNSSPEAKEDIWQPYRIEHIETESSVVKSFYLKPLNGQTLPEFKAGQFLPIRLHSKYSSDQGNKKPLVRTYTLSSATHEKLFRLSIKREEQGQASRWLHDEYKVGDTIECKKPNGDFFIDIVDTSPVVLIAGGIGITPLLSMAETIFHQNQQSDIKRELTIFHASKSVEERAFYNRLQYLKQQSNNLIQFISIISNTNEIIANESSINHIGRIDAELLKRYLTLNDHDFYLCGPSAFMQSCYDILITLGVDDSRINAEAFSTSRIIRHLSNETVQNNEAETAEVQFMRSSIKRSWQAGGPTLLEFAEQNNIDTEFSCRNGTCGSCVTQILSGEVAYRKTTSAAHNENEILLCCAVPKKGTGPLKLIL